MVIMVITVIYLVGFIVSVFILARVGHPKTGKYKDMFSSDYSGKACRTYGELWVLSFLDSTMWPFLLVVYLIENTKEIDLVD